MKLPAMLKSKATAPFAHLLGLPKVARADEKKDDEDKQRPDESDEDYAKRMEDEDEKDTDAEGDPEKKSDSEDGDGEDEDKKKSKKARRAEDGDDDESMRAVELAERARCAAIFGAEEAGVRPDLAAHLAFNTDMTSADATALLKAAAVGGRADSLSSRMGSVKVANVGSDLSTQKDDGSPKSIASKIIAAAAKARGEK